VGEHGAGDAAEALRRDVRGEVAAAEVASERENHADGGVEMSAGNGREDGDDDDQDRADGDGVAQ